MKHRKNDEAAYYQLWYIQGNDDKGGVWWLLNN